MVVLLSKKLLFGSKSESREGAWVVVTGGIPNVESLFGEMDEILTEDEKNRWKELAIAHSGRQAEFLRARLARRDALKQLGLGNAELERGTVRFSLSHTRSQAVALVVKRRGSGDPIQVGVDLERDDRQVSDGVWRKLVPTAAEEQVVQELGFGRIQVWALKEAIWKANPHREGTVMSQIRLLPGGKVEVPGGSRVEWFQESLPGWIVFFAATGLDFVAEPG